LSQDSFLTSIIMVAAHKYDVEAAQNLGFQTAYIQRSTEDVGIQVSKGIFDLYAEDLASLAAQVEQLK
jgi:hypothetical protein